jgi:hypothetical protein
MLRAQATRNGPITLAQSGVASSVTGTTAETTLASVTIPGGMMGVNGVLRVTFLTNNTNNVNSKTFRLKIGGVTVMPYTYGGSAQAQQMFILRNRGAQNVQTFLNSNAVVFGTTTATTVNTNFDMSVDQVLSITGQLAVGTDSMTLESYTVEVLPA